MSDKDKKFLEIIKVLGLTVITLGIYGAYWAMSDLFKEDDINTDEIEKDADYMKRSAASAFLTRFFTGR